MDHLLARERPRLSPEDTFASKYTWLLRWALHFVQNDRPAAEDLVQETFVRLLLSWDSLEDIHNLEPFLYSHLRYAYLTERRRDRRFTFQSLSTVEADALALRLRAAPAFQDIEIRNELRSILSFLLWKRHTTKFASIFLLRFFHGFFPEEIASICRSTRHSVDLGLRHARAEIKTYLLDPTPMQIHESARIPELSDPEVNSPLHEFVDSLRYQLLTSHRDACPPFSSLERYYHSDARRSIEPDLLAHVVSCERCLAEVTRCCGIHPISTRSIEDSLTSAPRLKESKRSSARSSLVRVATVASITIALIVAGCVLLSTRANHPAQRENFTSSLEKSVQVEGRGNASDCGCAVHQRVTIHADGNARSKDLYRDPQGRRHAKKLLVNPDEQLLRDKLAEAQMDWNNPLSAANFKSWHDHLAHPTDQLQESPSNLLTFTTASQSGPIRSESLTVRADNFHSVARSITLADNEHIDVAEISYEEKPWSQTTDQWFEPLQPVARPSINRAVVLPSAPVLPLSESQVDMATLSIMIALEALHAGTERLEVVPTPQAVEVRGVVESDSRKHQITSQLQTIPNVSVNIATYRELDENLTLSSSIHVIKAVSVVSGDSRFDNYCGLAHISQARCRELSYQLLSTATTLVLESKRLSQLRQQYPTTKVLTPAARDILASLVKVHADHLEVAIREQERIMAVLGTSAVQAGQAGQAGQTEQAGQAEAIDALDGSKQDSHNSQDNGVEGQVVRSAERNLSLTHELVYASNDQTREFSTLMDSLVASLRETKQAISRLPIHATDTASISVVITTPKF